MLEKIETKRKPKPPRALLYGVSGIGKSTFLSNLPRPIVIQTEEGLDGIEIDSFPLAKELRDVTAALEALRDNNHEYRTVCIDSLDWLEKLVWKQVCEDAFVDDIDEPKTFGYGRGYKVALKQWEKIISLLEDLRGKGMMVFLTGHSKIQPFKSPTTEDYDRFELDIHKSAAALWYEWCDLVLFVNWEVFTEKKKTADKAVIASGSGERVLYTERRPAFEAKNRYRLPAELPFDWEVLFAGIKEGMKVPDASKVASVKERLEQKGAEK